MLAGLVIGATAVTALHAQNKPSMAYADLDPRAINSPAVFKTLPSKTATSTAIPPDWADHSLTARFPLA